MSTLEEQRYFMGELDHRNDKILFLFDKLSKWVTSGIVTASFPPVWAVPGLFTGCFEQKSYVHSRGPHGPRAAPYEFCLPVRGP